MQYRSRLLQAMAQSVYLLLRRTQSSSFKILRMKYSKIPLRSLGCFFYSKCIFFMANISVSWMLALSFKKEGFFMIFLLVQMKMMLSTSTKSCTTRMSCSNWYLFLKAKAKWSAKAMRFLLMQLLMQVKILAQLWFFGISTFFWVFSIIFLARLLCRLERKWKATMNQHPDSSADLNSLTVPSMSSFSLLWRSLLLQRGLTRVQSCSLVFSEVRLTEQARNLRRDSIWRWMASSQRSWRWKMREWLFLKYSMSSMKILKFMVTFSLRGFSSFMYDSLSVSSEMLISSPLDLLSPTSSRKYIFILPKMKFSICTPNCQNRSSIFYLSYPCIFPYYLEPMTRIPPSAELIVFSIMWCTWMKLFREVQQIGTAQAQWFSAQLNISLAWFVMYICTSSAERVSLGQIYSQMNLNQASNSRQSSSLISGMEELETQVSTFLPFSVRDRPRLAFFSLLKQASANLSFQEWKQMRRTETWSSVMMSSFLVMFLRMELQHLFLLSCACAALRVERMVSTLSMESLQMGAMRGSSLSSRRVLQHCSQKATDLLKHCSMSGETLLFSVTILQYLMSCWRMLGNSQRFFSFSRSLFIVSSFWISFRFTEKVESILSASWEILSMDFSRTLSLSSTMQMLSFIWRTVSMLLMNLLQFSNTSDWISWSWIFISSSIQLFRRISYFIEFCFSMLSTQRFASKLHESMSILFKLTIYISNISDKHQAGGQIEEDPSSKGNQSV